MGIKDFFKKTFGKEKPKEEAVKRKINFNELDKIIEERLNEIEKNEKEAIQLIKEKVIFFTNELNEKIKILKDVNFFETKEKNEKIKSTVREGRKKYIELLERFIENILGIDENTIDNYTEKINTALTRFDGSSAKSYERATILIGKEMASIRESLRNLSSEILKIYNSNISITSEHKKINSLQLKNKEIKKIDNDLIKINALKTNLELQIEAKEKEFSKISEEIKKIKANQDYNKNIERKSALELKERELENEIFSLKQLIDFKALTNFFHTSEKKMERIKSYRDSFSSKFKEDKEEILNLLDESKLNNERIIKKVHDIYNKEQEINNIKKEIKEDETIFLSNSLRRIKEEIEDIKDEKERTNKIKEKLDKDKLEIQLLIKKELDSIEIN